MPSCKKLLNANKKWAKDQKELDPQFFSRLSTQQSPEFLWIGCFMNTIIYKQHLFC